LKDASNSSILNEKLVREYKILKAQAIDLNSTLTKFTKENENLYIIIGNQRCVFEKSDS
jgi:predicted transglutaminase-like protease